MYGFNQYDEYIGKQYVYNQKFLINNDNLNYFDELSNKVKNRSDDINSIMDMNIDNIHNSNDDIYIKLFNAKQNFIKNLYNYYDLDILKNHKYTLLFNMMNATFDDINKILHNNKKDNKFDRVSCLEEKDRFDINQNLLVLNGGDIKDFDSYKKNNSNFLDYNIFVEIKNYIIKKQNELMIHIEKLNAHHLSIYGLNIYNVFTKYYKFNFIDVNTNNPIVTINNISRFTENDVEYFNNEFIYYIYNCSFNYSLTFFLEKTKEFTQDNFTDKCGSYVFNLLNELVTSIKSKQNILFNYISGYCINQNQHYFIDTVKKSKNLNIYQSIMGSGKSTVVIPYIILDNYQNNKKTIVLVPDGSKIKTEMFNNINRIISLFDITTNFNKIKNLSNISNNKINEIIHLFTFKKIKKYFLQSYNLIKEHEMIVDEIDVFIDPIKSDYNIEESYLKIDNEILKQLILYTYIHYNNKRNININVDVNINNINNINKYRQQLDDYLQTIDTMDINKDYGLDKNDTNLYKIAMPFLYVDTPSYKSTFTEILLKIYATCYSFFEIKYYEKHLLAQLIFDFIKQFFKNTYIEIIRFITDYSIKKKYIKLDSNDLFSHNRVVEKIVNISITDNSLIKDIYNNKLIDIDIDNINKFIFGLKNYTDLLLSLLSHILSLNINIVKSLININSYDVINIYNNNINNKLIGQTGTPWVNVPNQVQKVFDSMTGNNYKLFKILYSTKILLVNNLNKINHIFNLIIDKNNIYNGLIDVGFYFNKTNFIESFIEYITLNKNSIGYKHRYIYFIKKNKSGADTETLYDVENKIYYDYNNNFNKKEIFYFIDNGNLTGVNVSFPTISHFLITTHNKSLIRDIQQGMFRLRLLDYTHTIDIIYHNNVDNNNNNVDNKNICYYQNK